MGEESEWLPQSAAGAPESDERSPADFLSGEETAVTPAWETFDPPEETETLPLSVSPDETTLLPPNDTEALPAIPPAAFVLVMVVGILLAILAFFFGRITAPRGGTTAGAVGTLQALSLQATAQAQAPTSTPVVIVATPTPPPPTPTPPPSPTPTPTPRVILHVVRTGETLHRIARRYGTTVAAIAAANQVVNPNYIQIGQVLRIPLPPGVVPAAGQVVHVVQTGENLFRIARCYGLTVERVAAVNGLSYPYTVYTGQRLIIPAAGPSRCPAGVDP